MQVKAKFRCHNVAKDQHSTRVQLSPVYSSDPNSPNHSWSKATPGGSIDMFITNPAAADAFELNKEYLITFEPAED